MTKKNVLIISILVTLFLATLFIVGSRTCYHNLTCRELDESKILDMLDGDYLLVLFVFPPILFLSLLTYCMKDEVFRAWWNFARWMLPIIILATIVANLMPNNHGFFNMDDLIYLFVLAPLYAILILVSLWKIIHAYRATK